MNQRIKELAEQAWQYANDNSRDGDETHGWLYRDKFAELIVKECKENFAKVWYEQGMDIRGAEIGKFLIRFDEHFGVEE